MAESINASVVEEYSHYIFETHNRPVITLGSVTSSALNGLTVLANAITFSISKNF